MHAMPSLVSSLAAATLFLAAASAPAQQVAVASHALTAAPAAAPRAVGAYRFVTPRDVRMPDEVTVADSAGSLVASFRYAGEGSAQPMVVHVFDTDLVLQGATPAGVLTLVLFRQNDADPRAAVAGRWWLGALEGELRGRARR